MQEKDTIGGSTKISISLKQFHRGDEVGRGRSKFQFKRKLWLKILWIPAHAWSKENVAMVGNVRGNVIVVAEADLAHFNSMKVLIEAEVAPNIRARMHIEVGGEHYLVMVKEIGGVIQDLHLANDGGQGHK
ncbi:hypothetical protein PIB30_060688 [Stylosanthes scabra]|uniref:Uncharacterized protein n=1 Tax=Stylosanthes scabra TaxID=79078 RepID=A0ABU6SLT1_9FABA|nr:hypothetical protein [Stylosanthes scabra]